MKGTASYKMEPVSDDIEPAEEEPEASGGNAEEEDAEESYAIRTPIDPAIVEALIPFRDLQRTIAAVDFSGLRAAQQAAASFATQLPDLSALQHDIQALIAQSVDGGSRRGRRS